MSTNDPFRIDPNKLEFRGRDFQECENFIASINRRAHAEGKLRDDQWIADLVAICLTNEALIWWSLLDEETQGSWRLLRQAMISRFRPLFYGKSGAEAEDFVYQIRQRALHVGKLDDPHWTAAFASGCFAGSALRWYMSLDSGVRGDWVLLQQAIFAQYSQGYEEGSLLPTVPTPASAAAAPAPAPGPGPSRTRLRGRIRVCRSGDPANYYLSKRFRVSVQPGRVMVTTAVADALEVEYESSPIPQASQTLFIPDGQTQDFDTLGMKWRFADTTATANFLALCGVNSSLGTASLIKGFAGPLLMKPWRVSGLGNNQGAMPLLGMGTSGERLLSLSCDGKSELMWFRSSKIDSDVDVGLFFEPV